MRGLWIEGGAVSYRSDLPELEPRDGEVRVQVTTAGVCATDLALRRGYMDFQGVPGHEFVGRALDGPFAGRRVVGDINAACGTCATCRAGRRTHCPHRTVLGIAGRAGAFAECLRLPEENLYVVPDAVGDLQAVFTEPLAAALEIGEQIDLVPGQRSLVIGDGRLGLLCAAVLAREGLEVTLAGRHPERAGWLGATVTSRTDLTAPGATGGEGEWDLVVEASGIPELLGRALELVRPRGTVVLKTTTERPSTLDLAIVVVNELRLVGSRCGPFERALETLESGQLELERFVDARYELANGASAFERAAESGVLKVLIDVAEGS